MGAAPGTGRTDLNCSSDASCVVPPYPVALQNAAYSGTAAYDAPSTPTTTAAPYNATVVLAEEARDARLELEAERQGGGGGRDGGGGTGAWLVVVKTCNVRVAQCGGLPGRVQGSEGM